jgi:hypothetical protein
VLWQQVSADEQKAVRVVLVDAAFGRVEPVGHENAHHHDGWWPHTHSAGTVI